jgi:hypothetical protein
MDKVELKPLGHDEAIDALCGCAATVTVLSYQEAIEGYLSLRGLPADPAATIEALQAQVEAKDAEIGRLKEALTPFAKLAGPINGEQGRPTYLEAIGGSEAGEELQLSAYVGNGQRIEILLAGDFRQAVAALGQGEG